MYIKPSIMRKQILFVLALFSASFVFAQDVKLTHNMPSSASAGQTIDVEYTVNKGNIGAFAKFQCDLPADYQAAAGDTKSGNFTFENNRVKIVWVSLPGDATFTFSYKMIIPVSASGSANINAQFYYLENNVKKEYAVPAHVISLGGGSVTTTTPVETTTTPVETKTIPVETTTTPVETKTIPVETTTTPVETKTTPVETTTTPVETTTTPVETTTTPVETTTTPVETKTTPVETKTTPVETKTITKTTTSKSGVTYYIQLAAVSNDPGGQFKKYGKTKVVQEGGMYKVLAGTYNSLEEARKHKADFANKGIQGCFVVGYENGTRVKL